MAGTEKNIPYKFYKYLKEFETDRLISIDQDISRILDDNISFAIDNKFIDVFLSFGSLFYPKFYSNYYSYEETNLNNYDCSIVFLNGKAEIPLRALNIAKSTSFMGKKFIKGLIVPLFESRNNKPIIEYYGTNIKSSYTEILDINYRLHNYLLRYIRSKTQEKSETQNEMEPYTETSSKLNDSSYDFSKTVIALFDIINSDITEFIQLKKENEIKCRYLKNYGTKDSVSVINKYKYENANDTSSILNKLKYSNEVYFRLIRDVVDLLIINTCYKKRNADNENMIETYCKKDSLNIRFKDRSYTIPSNFIRYLSGESLMFGDIFLTKAYYGLGLGYVYLFILTNVLKSKLVIQENRGSITYEFNIPLYNY